MALMISTTANYHWVKKISAHTHGGGALTLTLHGDCEADSCQFNQSEIVVFTDDVALTERLIAAINGAAEKPKAAAELAARPVETLNAAELESLLDASKGGNVRGITEDHRFEMADRLHALRAASAA